jgi:hypothetical protein
LGGVLAVAGRGSDEHGDDLPTAVDQQIVIDSDAGLDDAIAILYLASSPDVDVRAVRVSRTGLAHGTPGRATSSGCSSSRGASAAAR